MPSSTSLSAGILPSLLSLLPSYTPATLPPTLPTHADSLLAQSRLRASHLKPDEEIARAYACCEIACTRFRAKLRLPPVKAGGQPCKPAVYRKLVTFLGGVLGEIGQETPKNGKKRGADGVVKNGFATPEKGGKASGTPSRSTRGNTDTNTFLGRIKASAKKSTEQEGSTDGEAPSYTMPRIRSLCRRFSTPLLAPHVYTGVCVVLKLAGLWPVDDDDSTEESLEENVTGLLIGLYLMMLIRMQKAKTLRASVYQVMCIKAAEILAYKPGRGGVEAWIRRVNQQKWGSDQDWFHSAPANVFVFEFDPDAGEDQDEESEVGDDTEETRIDQEDGDEDDLIISRRKRKNSKGGRGIGSMSDEDDPEGVLLPGLHTMMQEGPDYSSDEKTREFEKWQKLFLQKLDRLDKPLSVKAVKAVAVK